MACDEGDAEVASLLLSTLELAMIRPAPEGNRNRRKNLEALAQLRESVLALRKAPKAAPPQESNGAPAAPDGG